MKIQSSKLIRPVWANKEGTNNVFVFKACRYCPSTVWATRETRASSPFQPLPSSTFPSQGSFHDSEALGQGRGWRERQAWLPWALASLVAPHTSTEETFHTCRTSPGSAELTKGPLLPGPQHLLPGSTRPTKRLQRELQPLTNFGRCRQSSLKKRVKESKAAAFLWSKPVDFLT